ncbi:MAG: response regulator [Balneolales bacterium]|nr:response regulator [Balneolales bacterium]
MMNVLIVEDDLTMRAYMKISLLKCSYKIDQIFEAKNGYEAMAILKKESINFIFTDIMMPQMDGVELMKWLHNQPKYQHVPVVAVTSECGDQLLNMLSFWGHGYVQKPYSMPILENQLSNFYKKNNDYNLYG